VDRVPFKPIVQALDDVEASAAQVVLAASEQMPGPGGELSLAVARLATALWELQMTRERVQGLARELGSLPLHVVGA